MALVLADRVKDTTTTTGTGTVTLSGTAPTGYQTFGTAIGNANTTYYTIVNSTEWEVGLGTYTASGTTLSRTTVLASSNAGALVNFSAGAKDVFVTYPAGKSVYLQSNGSLLLGTTTGANALRVGGTLGDLKIGPSTGTQDSYFYMDSTNVYNFVLLQNSGVTFGTFLGVSSTGLYYNFANHVFRNGDGSTEYARIDTSGYVLVGLTSATGTAKLQVSGPLRTTGYTVSTLPAGTVGMRTYVTDASGPTALATVAGGGAVTVPVFYNGSNWIVA